ncbi:ELL-associated factor 1-like isoform X2 [Biomphalaria glabrata]|nr:ELL-associated factor 1-like [Biomphalaria glabrata]XP_013094973.1 ELL-associated factor 1-like [Biomphalaria glabrata]KAI8755279.1 ELL-associated factor 1-like isoform X2 [Biomphalaria glabrata]KAI8792805.1 ELL-associated factor 1 isoform X2 [Biomphalaria glabrata]
MSLPVDNEIHELKLGDSFNAHSNVGFHTIRYDFKPASVDTNKEACVEVGGGNQVTVTVPHVEGSGVTHTVFKGNKQPVMKECVLIIDHNTGTYTLEKLTSKITVKKTRLDGSSKAIQHIAGRVTPVDKKQAAASPAGDNYSITPVHSEASKGNDDVALLGEITDSSDDEENNVMPTISSGTASNPMKFDVLDDDLALSESGSDSD